MVCQKSTDQKLPFDWSAKIFDENIFMDCQSFKIKHDWFSNWLWFVKIISDGNFNGVSRLLMELLAEILHQNESGGQVNCKIERIYDW